MDNVLLKRKNVYSITIYPSDYAPLKKPVETFVSIHEDDEGWIGWFAENDDFGIMVCVSSSLFPKWKWWMLRNLKKEIVIDIDFMVDQYIIHHDKKTAPKLTEQVNRLQEIIDPANRKEKRHWEIYLACDTCSLNPDGGDECACCPSCGSERTVLGRRGKDGDRWKCKACNGTFVTAFCNCHSKARKGGWQ